MSAVRSQGECKYVQCELYVLNSVVRVAVPREESALEIHRAFCSFGVALLLFTRVGSSSGWLIGWSVGVETAQYLPRMDAHYADGDGGLWHSSYQRVTGCTNWKVFAFANFY